jgi:hypothetical protein
LTPAVWSETASPRPGTKGPQAVWWWPYRDGGATADRVMHIPDQPRSFPR